MTQQHAEESEDAGMLEQSVQFALGRVLIRGFEGGCVHMKHALLAMAHARASFARKGAGTLNSNRRGTGRWPTFRRTL